MGSASHIIAGFTIGFRHRMALSALLAATPGNSTILGLNPAELKQNGIRALALDFDGVLSPHGFEHPLPEAEQWLKKCVSSFGEDNIFILSNKPTPERAEWFRSNFSRMRFISGVRKKPYPEGLQMIGTLVSVPLHSILMVDDRLLTGCLAAINAGARPCYISTPYVSFSHRPFSELFFMLLRLSDRCFIRLTSML
jgi:uncharacterized protein